MSTGRESGRLLLLRIEEARWSAALDRLFRNVAPGGLLLDCPLADSVDSIRNLLRKATNALPNTPFLAIREEGGPQGPFQEVLPGLPSPRATAQRGSAAAGRLGELIGETLSMLGFNANLAPTLDLATGTTEKTMGGRSFGPNSKAVAECGAAFVRGLEKHKILACGKHFPGMGSVPQAAAGCLPVSGKPMAALWREDLLPFREIAPQLPMILISSASYKAYDFDRPRPACLSPLVVEGLLRVKLGYPGIVVAHDLEAKAVRGNLSVGEAAVESLLAGCDMMIVNADAASETARELQAAMDSGKIPVPRFRKSLARIEETGRRLKPPQARVANLNFAAMAGKVGEFARELWPEGKENG